MSVSLIIDIVLLIVSALIILKFTMRGFLRSVLDTFKVFVAAGIAYILKEPIANIFDGLFMRNSITGWVRNSLTQSVAGNETVVDFVDLYNKVPQFFNNVLRVFGLEDVSGLNTLTVESTAEQIEPFAVEIGSSISKMLSVSLAVLVVFVVAMIVLSIVIKILDGLTNFAAVKIINRILGCILGVALSVAIIWGVSYALTFLVEATGGFGGKFTKEMLDGSMLVNLIGGIF